MKHIFLLAVATCVACGFQKDSSSWSALAHSAAGANAETGLGPERISPDFAFENKNAIRELNTTWRSDTDGCHTGNEDQNSSDEE
mmetsp:Transcript_12283/g.14027  ORF Transcript_12283/g.14027 Transcript_12283/m.14027 type:complete len:85 (-) Transcript_12283:459-713(-)